jgi:hypothetical protein
MERFFLRTLPLREDGKVRRIYLRVRVSRKDPPPLFSLRAGKMEGYQERGRMTERWGRRKWTYSKQEEEF